MFLSDEIKVDFMIDFIWRQPLGKALNWIFIDEFSVLWTCSAKYTVLMTGSWYVKILFVLLS